MDRTDLLREEYTIDTPENVTFGYEVTGIGSRFVAALLDSTLLVVLLALLNVVVVVSLSALPSGGDSIVLDEEADPGWVGGLVVALYILLNFLVVWGYYLAFELLWNGQSPGKRLVGIRVLQLDGTPAGFMATAVRNLVRFVDFLPFAYAIGFVTMLFNRQARRLGDYAAGTLVVKARADLVLAALGTPTMAPRPPSTPDGTPALGFEESSVRHLTAEDYRLLVDVLTRRQRGELPDYLLARLAATVAAKLHTPAPSAGRDTVQFLSDVAEAYRRSIR